MKYILIILFMVLNINANSINAVVNSVNSDLDTVTVKLDKINLGMSGFVYHNIDDKHKVITNSVVVKSFHNKIAVLSLKPFHLLDNDALDSIEYKVKVGDSVELAFGYDRALLIAPNEPIYHKITKHINIQWIHPDLFATVLAYRSHPSPVKSDFQEMSNESSVGLLFIYLDKKLYTLDMQTLKILAIGDVSFEQKKIKLPFYTRVQKLESHWWKWGAGTSQMKNYTNYYYNLLLKYNKNNIAFLISYKNFKKELKNVR